MKETAKSGCFTATVDTGLSEKMKKDLVGLGFELSQPPHTYFSAKKSGVSCTMYLTGKLTVQGKNKEEFISYYLEPEILKDFSYTYTASALDTTERIGDDESGKGDFFGPLCVAGLFAGGEGVKKLIDLGVKDSKELNDATIVRISRDLKKHFPHKILRLYPTKYNELYEKIGNLNHLLAWCHSSTIEALITETGCSKVILDQFAPASLMVQTMKKKRISLDLTQRPRAEEDPVVAAASILARASFVEGMDLLSQEMGIELPKGASSKVIQVGKRLVAKHGPEVLGKVAKLHFKTKDAIIND